MKKYLLFLLLLSNPIRAMEYEDCSCMRLISHAIHTISSWFFTHKESPVIIESQRIQDLRTYAQRVEDALVFSKNNDPELIRQCVKYDRVYGLELDEARYFHALLEPFTFPIHAEPKRFLRYCYYQRFHKSEGAEDCFTQLRLHADLLAQCKKMHENKCSALGAAILARKVKCVSARRAFIQKLMAIGFVLTEQDRTLAALDFYDKIPAQEKYNMILLLCDYEDACLYALPHDVRHYIVQYMVACAKQKHCLIP